MKLNIHTLKMMVEKAKLDNLVAREIRKPVIGGTQKYIDELKTLMKKYDIDENYFDFYVVPDSLAGKENRIIIDNVTINSKKWD